MTTYFTATDHLTRTIDDRQWVVTAPGSVRQYPRTPEEAVWHAVSYMSSSEVAPYPWTGRAMTAVARCFGLRSADTGDIPSNIPGDRYSAIRQYRWLSQTYPDYVVPAPSPFTFGESVPMGAVMYWDESAPYGASVGICAGYRRGILQVLTTTSDPATKNWGLKDVEPYGCAGWTVPLFYARSSNDLWSLWDGDQRTVPSEYDFYRLTMDPLVATYDSPYYRYDESRIETTNIWDLGERRPAPTPVDPPELIGEDGE